MKPLINPEVGSACMSRATSSIYVFPIDGCRYRKFASEPTLRAVPPCHRASSIPCDETSLGAVDEVGNFFLAQNAGQGSRLFRVRCIGYAPGFPDRLSVE